MLKELNSLKNKLEHIEKNIVEKVEEIQTKEEKWEELEKKVQEIREIKKDEIININVGGKKFATKLQTLMNIKDNLFHKLIVSKRFNFKNGIFIDRSPKMFPYILDFFRKQEIKIKRFSKEELEELKEDAIYYEVLPLENLLGDDKKVIKYLSMEVNEFYNSGSEIIGQTNLEVLLDRNLNTGICTNSPGKITLELDKVAEVNQIEIGGFTGKSDWVYENGYGAGATIFTSSDKKNWTNVGCVPSGFGKNIIKFKVVSSTAKWIKIEGTGWLGIGYLKLSS